MEPEEISEDTEPYLTIFLNESTKHFFADLPELSQWIDRQTAYWEWIRSVPQSPDEIGNLRRVYLDAFAQMRQYQNSLNQAPDDVSRKQNVSNLITNFYRGLGLIDTHPFAIIARKTSERWGPRAGAAALAALLKRPIEASIFTSDYVIGVVEAILNKDAISPHSIDALKELIENLTAQYEDVSAKQKSELAHATQNALQLISDTRATLDAKLALFDQSSTEVSANLSREAKESIQEIRSTDKTYKEHMALKAPVGYWNEEAKRHRKAESKFALASSVFAIAALVGLVIALYRAVSFLAEPAQLKDNPYPYLASATGFALIVSIIFWAGRILIRLFLSARHLAMDAEERVALIQTYLALTQDGKLSDTERSLVLAPIFRSSSDGIVKDEGAPEISIAALLGKLLDKK